MKRNLTAFVVGAIAGLLLFAGVGTFSSAAALNDREVTIKGTVQAITDEDDEIVGVYIETEDQDYLVADNAVGQELRRHVGKMVEVKGEIRNSSEDEESDPTIVVKSYKLIEVS